MSCEHASGYMGRPCKGHKIGCLLLQRWQVMKQQSIGEWRRYIKDGVSAEGNDIERILLVNKETHPSECQ